MGLLCAVCLACWAPAVLAHASLLGSVPASGAIVAYAPGQAVLAFNEPVSPLVVTLVQPDGTSVIPTQIDSVQNELHVALPDGALPGTYALSWRVRSADGHPVGGTVMFSVGSESAAAPVDQADRPRQALLWLLQAARYIALFTAIGLAVWRSAEPALAPLQGVGRHMAAAGIAATLVHIGLQGLDALDRPWSALFSSEVWRVAIVSSSGLSGALALLALLLAVLIWTCGRSQLKAGLSVAMLLLLGASMAVSGHAATAPPRWLSRPAVLMHGITALLWTGSFIPLRYALRRRAHPRVLRLFSRLIPFVLLVLVASGTILAYLQLDALRSLWLTAYGRVLLIKLAFVACLLCLGAYNRFRLTNPVLEGRDRERCSMRRIVGMEVILGALILGTVSLWRFTPPPRVLQPAAAPGAVLTRHVHGDLATAKVVFTPGTPGIPASLSLELTAPDDTPLPAQEIDVLFSSPSAGIEPLVFAAEKTANDLWHISPLTLPRQPHWHLRIRALISDFERVNLETELDLPG